MKKGVIILLSMIAIEILSFIYYDPQNIEMFSFVWAFVFGVLLVYRWHGYGFNLFGIASSDTERYQNLAMSRENSNLRRNIKQKGSFIFDLIVGILFLANLLISILIY